jgi:hypothetical protein
MTSPTRSKIAALILGAALSVTWLSTIVVGLQSETKPVQRTIELPTVVIVGHKLAASNATAQSPAQVAKVG